MKSIFNSLAALSLMATVSCISSRTPETAQLFTEDAERFAALYERSDGQPDAQSLEQEYLKQGTRAIGIFTRGRIRNSNHLAKTVAAKPDLYQRAIDVCLPAAQAATPDLQDVYRRYAEIIDNPRLPEAYAVFGANSSGGTAGKNAIVIGLEVICRVAPGDSDEVRVWLKRYFAHEVVHTLQVSEGDGSLLTGVMSEGSADFIATLVADGTVNDKAAAWYQQHKAEVWARFESDMASLPDGENGLWLYAGKSRRPEGWPRDLGYVIGADIARTYYDNAADKKQAVEDILKARGRASAFLAESGYAEQFSNPRP